MTSLEQPQTAAPLPLLTPAADRRRPALIEAVSNPGGVGLAAVLLLIFAIVLQTCATLLADSYLMLASGRLIAHDGIPHRETWTLAAQGHHWIDQQWLADLIVYKSWTVGGYTGPALVAAFACTSGFVLLGALAIRRGATSGVALVAVAVAFTAAFGNVFLRAQMFSIPLFVLVLWAILADESRPRFDWRLPVTALPVLCLWANIHGACALAALVVSGYAATRAVLALRRRDRRSGVGYGAVTVAAPLTLFANPYGFGVLPYYTALIGNHVLPLYQNEWKRPGFDTFFGGWCILLMLGLAAGIGLVFGRRRRLPVATTAIAVALAIVATRATRYEPWFGLATALFLVDACLLLGPWRTLPNPKTRRLLAAGALSFAIASVGASVVAFARADREVFVPRRGITALAAYAATHPHAVILSDDATADAILWHAPSLAMRLPFDGRLEQYRDSQLRQWYRYMLGLGDWQRLTRRYDVLVASGHRNPGLAGRLRRLSGWRKLYDGADGVVLVRR